MSGLPWLDAPSHKAWKMGVSGDPAPGTGALKGKQLEPWYIAKLIYEAGWQEMFEATISLMVCLAESQGYTEAIHVNTNGTRDRGIWQLNSIHQDCPDEVAYDEVKATDYAFNLWLSARGWSPWQAYNLDVYLHDSYLGRSVRGTGNYIARSLLDMPVADWAGQPYTHKLAGSILDFQHRVAGAVAWINRGKKDLGWQPATKNKVDVVQSDLSHGLTAAKAALPGSPLPG